MKPAAEERLPIRTVAALTGVNAITLRAWERRYGLIRPLRTSKGHRLYTRRDVETIHRVLALIERGISVGQVGDALAANNGEPAATGTSVRWRSYRRDMAAAIERFDEQALDDTYDSALGLHSIQNVSQFLLTPLLVDLGRRWQRGAGGVAEEHFFSVYLRNKLGARLHHRSRLNSGPRLVAACAPGEQHEIGVLLFSLAAQDAGLRIVILGANSPIDEIAIAARSGACHGIVISSSVDPVPTLLSRDLPRLVRTVAMPVFVGGPTSARRRKAIAAAGAVPLGSDLLVGARMVRAALQVDSARS